MIKIAINGYGNLGRGVEKAIMANSDMECVVVFSRRDPDAVHTLGAPVVPVSDMQSWVDKVDVCINCGGSATDLDIQGPQTVEFFNTVDSFDTHAKIPQHFEAVDAAARKAGHCAIISSGWDPGVFSMLRVLSDAVLPRGKSTTFWGPGVSQGHSDAIRRIDGVVDARQYTVPIEASVSAVEAGEDVELTPRMMHRRIAYVQVADGADRVGIERQIVEMPNYFADYDTEVHFVSAEEMQRDHAGLPHGGIVIHNGSTSDGVKHTIGFKLALDSNPEFTGSVLVATARACAKKAARGETGCATVFDLTLTDLSAHGADELRAHFL